MAVTISFTCSDAAATELVDAFCDRYNYAANQQASETRAQFARRMLIEQIKAMVVDHRRDIALASVATEKPDIT